MDINTARKRIKNIMASKSNAQQPLLFRHIFKINLDHDILLSKIISRDNTVYMKSPDSNNSYLGFDTALEYNINSKKGSLNLRLNQHNVINRSCVQKGSEMVLRCWIQYLHRNPLHRY